MLTPREEKARSRARKAKRLYDGRSPAAYRLAALIAAHLEGIDEPGEEALALAKAAAVATVRLDKIEAAEVKGEEVNDEVFVRVAGQLGRSLRALADLRAKQQTERQAVSSDGVPADLAFHLERLAKEG
jgi:hypothetical protein